MPVINIVLEDLNRMLKDKLSSTDFANIIPKIGADPDEINDSEAIVEFFPDRPDLLSTEGVARALRSFTEQSLGLIEYEVKPQTTHMFISKEVMEIRPCISGGIVRGVTLDDISIKCLMELQEKLHVTLGRKRKKVSIGIHDLSKIEGPFTYDICSPHEPAFVPLQKDYEMTPEEIISWNPIGDPAAVAECLSDEIKRVGSCHIALYMTMGNTDHEVAMRSIRRFGDEVVPLIEKEVGPLAGVNVPKPMQAAE